ncbi:MAG: trigger factor, partial [Christensenellaceae bacterium]
AYGKGVFFEDALNVLFSENYGKILDKEEKKFTAVGDPELSVDDLSDEGVTLVAVTPVKPEVKIGSYKGMKIKEFAYNVEDADVDKEIERLLDRNARKIEVSDRPCQNGDTVNIDFVGTIDGVKFDGGEAAGFDLTLGSGQFIPVRGSGRRHERRREQDVSVRFPENYQAEAQARTPCSPSAQLRQGRLPS